MVSCQRCAKYTCEKYILCYAIFLTKRLRSFLADDLTLSAQIPNARRLSIFVRIKTGVRAAVFQYRSVKFFRFFILFSLYCLFVVKRCIIGSICLCRKFFALICPVNIRQNNRKRCAVCNQMMHVKEQITSLMCPMYLNSEQRLLKQRKWPYQFFPVHAVNNLSGVFQMIIPALAYFTVLIHKKLRFQIWVRFHCLLYCFF